VDVTGADVRGALERAGRLVERRVEPGRTYDGWGGRDVLCHLGAYARLVGAILAAEAEGRAATEPELYGRDLTDAERATVDLDEINEAVRRESAALSYDEALAFWREMHASALAQLSRLGHDRLLAPGPSHPPSWRRPRLADVVGALAEHYEGHMESASHS